MTHGVFVIEAEAEEGIAHARDWAERELGLQGANNPDIIIARHTLFSVADARRIADLASRVAFAGNSRVLVISAQRAYHEAQNALLKLFEEPPAGTYLFLILPNLGGLLPTLRSRVQVVRLSDTHSSEIDLATVFLQANLEKRRAVIKKLTSGKDDDARSANRAEALALVNAIEALLYAKYRTTMEGPHFAKAQELLVELVTLRDYLHDRSAPVRLALEHLALVLTKDLV